MRFMKYDAQLQEVQRLLPAAKNILIALPANASVDNLAAGLALYLSLEEVQKQVNIVCEGPILVNHANLFGVGQIQNRLPQTNGGNLTITLSGVAAPDGTVPALQRLDWNTSGADLNLVFKVASGQTFAPAAITPHYQGSSMNLIFTVGTSTLDSIGALYTNNRQAFEGVHVANIDNQPRNTQFGSTNLVDPAASSLSEMTAQVISGLKLPLDQDIATNILTGIFSATGNLQSGNVTADTYQTVSEALKAGGQKMAAQPSLSQQPQPFSTAPFGPTQSPEKQPPPLDITAAKPSAEERPMGEGVQSPEEIVSPEPDWLTPKVFKGSLG